jgi:hypothetical protein
MRPSCRCVSVRAAVTLQAVDPKLTSLARATVAARSCFNTNIHARLEMRAAWMRVHCMASEPVLYTGCDLRCSVYSAHPLFVASQAAAVSAGTTRPTMPGCSSLTPSGLQAFFQQGGGEALVRVLRTGGSSPQAEPPAKQCGGSRQRALIADTVCVRNEWLVTCIDCTPRAEPLA